MIIISNYIKRNVKRSQNKYYIFTRIYTLLNISMNFLLKIHFDLIKRRNIHRNRSVKHFLPSLTVVTTSTNVRQNVIQTSLNKEHYLSARVACPSILENTLFV